MAKFAPRGKEAVSLGLTLLAIQVELVLHHETLPHSAALAIMLIWPLWSGTTIGIGIVYWDD